MLRTKFKNQQIEQKLTFLWAYSTYQVILDYISIKTTEAILYSGHVARWYNYAQCLPKLCSTACTGSIPAI